MRRSIDKYILEINPEKNTQMLKSKIKPSVLTQEILNNMSIEDIFIYCQKRIDKYTEKVIDYEIVCDGHMIISPKIEDQNILKSIINDYKNIQKILKFHQLEKNNELINQDNQKYRLMTQELIIENKKVRQDNQDLIKLLNETKELLIESNINIIELNNKNNQYKKENKSLSETIKILTINDLSEDSISNGNL